jgi:hypothetical protein
LQFITSDPSYDHLKKKKFFFPEIDNKIKNKNTTDFIQNKSSNDNNHYFTKENFNIVVNKNVLNEYFGNEENKETIYEDESSPKSKKLNIIKVNLNEDKKSQQNISIGLIDLNTCLTCNNEIEKKEQTKETENKKVLSFGLDSECNNCLKENF